MKKWISLLFVLIACSHVMAEELDLYLCIGQSNMAGRGKVTPDVTDTVPDVYLFNGNNEFEPAAVPLNKYSTIRKDIRMQGVGPAYSFSRIMAEKTGHKIGLIVNARGGSSIKSWKKGAKDGFYEQALSRTREAMKHGKLKAILWHQGETDCSNAEWYKGEIAELVANLRKDLDMPDLFFVAGEIAVWAPNEKQANNIRTFNEMIRNISEFIPHSACVSSEGLKPLINEADPHFCTESQIVLGERYAHEVLLHVGGACVLYIGDSITDGNWGGGGARPSSQRNQTNMNHIYGSGYMYLCASYYQGYYPQKNYTFHNRGISGNTLTNLEKRWEEDAIAPNPDVLSVLIGTNDVHHYLLRNSTTPFDFNDWEARYRALLDRSLKANPDLKIVLCAPFTAYTGSMRKSNNYAVHDSMIRRCAVIVERIARDYRATFIPFNTLFDKLYGGNSATPAMNDLKDTYWIWDGIHPTPAGHRHMADLWIKEVNL